MKLPSIIKERSSHGELSRITYIKSIGRATPTTPSVPVPQINCTGARNYMSINLSDPTIEGYYSSFTYDQRYAVKVGNDIFNADHAVSIIGTEFRVGPYEFYIPPGSEGYVVIYVNDNENTDAVRITFIPSPNVEYNKIYNLNDYDSSPCEVSYINRNSPMTFCLKPNAITVSIISCEGASSFFGFSTKELNYDGNGNDLNHNALKYNVAMNGVDYGIWDLTYGDNFRCGNISLTASVGSSGSGYVYAGSRNGSDVADRFTFTPLLDMVDANFWGGDTEDNPTVVYKETDRSIRVCLTSSGNT